MQDLAALLASANIVVKGKRIYRDGIQIDRTQRSNRDAKSVAVAYALGYMA